MSRIGKAPIAIPAGVTVEVKDHVVTVKGKNGSLEQVVNPDINVTVEDGQLAGGFGSALADFLAGYPIYIPGTLIIKAMMALIISLVPLFFAKSKNNFFRIGFIIFSILAELLMVEGYYLYEAVIIGEGFVAAFAGVSGNIVQGIVGIVGSYFLVELLSRTKIFTMCGSNGFVKGQKK